jgi:hypothetical protein
VTRLSFGGLQTRYLEWVQLNVDKAAVAGYIS